MITTLEWFQILGAGASAVGTGLMAGPFVINGRNRDASWLLSMPAPQAAATGSVPQEGEKADIPPREGKDEPFPKGGKPLDTVIEARAQDDLNEDLARKIPWERRLFVWGHCILFLGLLVEIVTLYLAVASN